MSDLEDWRGDVAVFPSEYETTPSAMYSRLSWDELVSVIAHKDGPLVHTSKSQLLFVVPCLLDATKPYTGKTAERFALGAYGPMRSNAHVADMTATWLIFDLDQSDRDEVLRYLRALRDSEVTFLAYTTYSNGAPDKPGFRMRVVIPVDRPMTAAEYKAAHGVLNARSFDGKADKTGERLSQQQSVWGCHPNRRTQAKRCRSDAGVLRIEELLKQAPKPRQQFKRSGASIQSNQSGLPSVQRIEKAMPWLIADDGYGSWSGAMMAFAALRAHVGEEAAGGFAQRYHQTSPPESTRSRLSHLPQYDPAQVIAKTPTMSADAAAGYLLGQAKARAQAALQDWQLGLCQDEALAKDAALYLAAFHPGAYAAMCEDSAAPEASSVDL